MTSLPIYYDADADPAALKDRLIAVLGYGSQGRSHALNLRDSGHRVIVAQRRGGPNHDRARQDGFEPTSIADATARADLLIFALPDETMAEIFREEIQPALRPGTALGFLHGFCIHFRAIDPPPGVDVIMIAPKGPGALVREAFQRGGGLPCILAVHQDATGQAKAIALAWGRGIGGGRAGMIEATFAQECESDLFGEQAVLCGGVFELMKAAFDILVEAGYPPEIAYIECIHEVKQVVDMQFAQGLAGMRERISRTAAYGGLTRGTQVVTDETRRRMRAILQAIRTGQFAAEWLAECRSGKRKLADLLQAEGAHASESVGEAVRGLIRRAGAKGESPGGG